MGARWKESKSRLVFAIKLASASPDSSSRLAMLKPVNIKSDEEWNDFVKEKLSENFEVISFIGYKFKCKLHFTNEIVLCSKPAINSKHLEKRTKLHTQWVERVTQG